MSTREAEIEPVVAAAIKNAFASAKAKLKAGMDEGPGGTVVLTTEEACLVWRMMEMAGMV